MAGSGSDTPMAYLVTNAADIVYELEDAETALGRAESNDIVSNHLDAFESSAPSVWRFLFLGHAPVTV